MTFWSDLRARSVSQLCPMCDPTDCSPPGSSVRGILQARRLEWFTLPSSRGSSPPRDRTHSLLRLLHWQAGSFLLVPPGKPQTYILVRGLPTLDMGSVSKEEAQSKKLEGMAVAGGQGLGWNRGDASWGRTLGPEC